MQATSFAARLAHHHTTIPSFDPLVSINPFLPSTTTSTMYPAVRTSHSHQIHLAKQTPARISSRSRCCCWCCCRRKQASHPAIQPPSRNDVQTRLCRALIPPPLPLCLSAPVPARAHVLRCDVMCVWPTEPSEAWHFRRARGIPLLFGRRAAPLASFLWGWKTTVLYLRLALPPRPLLCLLPFAFFS